MKLLSYHIRQIFQIRNICIILLCLQGFSVFLFPDSAFGKRNRGQIYEDHIKSLLKERNLLPDSLHDNDAGFIHNGAVYYVEIKNKDAPDFGQRGLIWNKTDGWQWRHKDMISDLYDQFGVISYIDKNFIPRRYSVIPEEQITAEDKLYDQRHFEKRGIILDNTGYLFEYYAGKNCFYIQVEGSGFYYLKEDVAKLGVPQYSPGLTLRLRAKTHHSNPIYQYGFFAVIQSDKKIPKSPYDLEEKVGKFPFIKP